ncbi:sensor histidine kinase [Niallia sp. FSL W8-0635]|uniref:sensor histidine kinase n=1 Tax=Niallia sp. FSL W8-0635 TaxID=2975337 RepID=UPI0030F586CF
MVIFFGILIVGLLIPIIALVLLSIMKLLNQEFDYLHMENKQIQLEKQLQQMEYEQLSQKIRPHFLFNSLNAMMSLARLKRNDDLITAMEQFSLFLKYQHADQTALVLFERELFHTNNYLSIQQLRFGKKLTIAYELDERAYQTQLPSYTLQTLVENAFKHGLEKKRGEKHLMIALKRHGDWVRLTVSDNGDRAIEQKSGHGTGLENIKKRLELLFEMYTDVSLKRKDNATEATVIWPYTPEGER